MVIIISYNKQTWNEYDDSQTTPENLANGAIISADRLNHMENGISNNDTNKVTDNKDGTVEVNGNSITPADDSKVVHTADTSNWQKQAMFNPSTLYLGTNPTGTKFATYVNANFNNAGVYYIRDNNANAEGADHALDVTLLVEPEVAWKYAFGVSWERGMYYRSVTPNGDTGWKLLANDSKVAHLSGANNFDTVPTVNNNPLLLASSLPSDLARTGSDQEFTGKNTFDTAPIDKTTGNPYITDIDLNNGLSTKVADNKNGSITVNGATFIPADDSKVIHNSGNEEINGQKTFDTAPIDKTSGNPYITRSDVPEGNIQVVTQAQYDALADKTGLYVIQG